VTNIVQWLLESDEPWTRYRTLLDLLDRPEDDPGVQAARAEMLAHPQVRGLIAEAATWPGYALKRHNDAKHAIYKFSTLADFGVRAEDPSILAGIEVVMTHQSPEGAFQTVVLIPKAFGGTGEETWTWMLCDTPTLLYALLGFGLRDHPAVQRAVEHLTSLIRDNGWPCAASPDMGSKFKGPGRRSDPCPIVNVYALKALSQVPESLDSPATRTGAEMLLWHWEHQSERKPFMFGIGTDFRKLKYPFVWYNILHVVECSAASPSSTPIRASARWWRQSSNRRTKMDATPPPRCTAPGRTGLSPARRTPRRGLLFWC
jgi:hypothetical protein